MSIKKAREIDGIKIIRYESSIFYANVENFTYNIIKLARVNPIEINEKIAKRRAEYMKKINRLNGTQCSKKVTDFLFLLCVFFPIYI